MRAFLFAAAAFAAAFVAVPVSAQQPRPTGPVASPPPVFNRPSLPPFRDPSAPNNPYRAFELDRRIFTEELTRIAQGREPKARLDRAARVGALIDLGQCGPAAQLARSEHDDAMADRVPQACAAQRTHRRS